MMVTSNQVLPLKKSKIQNKFRNVSHEKILTNLNKINKSKESMKTKLKKENNEKVIDTKIPNSNKSNNNNFNTSIF